MDREGMVRIGSDSEMQKSCSQWDPVNLSKPHVQTILKKNTLYFPAMLPPIPLVISLVICASPLSFPTFSLYSLLTFTHTSLYSSTFELSFSRSPQPSFLGYIAKEALNCLWIWDLYLFTVYGGHLACI